MIRIRGQDSPNVKYALAQLRNGEKPTHEMLVPGVLPYADYVKRRETWDPIRQLIGLDAKFPKDVHTLMFPPEWLTHSERLADELRGKRRHGEGIGIDTAEGGDNTVFTACDSLGLIEQISMKTPDTNVIVGTTIAFGQKHRVPPKRWVFDRGGGGKEHADRLRAAGYPVRTVAFGGAASQQVRKRKQTVPQRNTQVEERYSYKNMRAELFGEARVALNPADGGFGIPTECAELIRQLSLIPLMYDENGRMMLLPKRKRKKSYSLEVDKSSDTLTGLLGCSPDEADSFVLALYAVFKAKMQMAGPLSSRA